MGSINQGSVAQDCSNDLGSWILLHSLVSYLVTTL